jgi:hypothetical protein
VAIHQYGRNLSSEIFIRIVFVKIYEGNEILVQIEQPEQLLCSKSQLRYEIYFFYLTGKLLVAEVDGLILQQDGAPAHYTNNFLVDGSAGKGPLIGLHGVQN